MITSGVSQSTFRRIDCRKQTLEIAHDRVTENRSTSLSPIPSNPTSTIPTITISARFLEMNSGISQLPSVSRRRRR
jgi:hypothetical protein